MTRIFERYDEEYRNVSSQISSSISQLSSYQDADAGPRERESTCNLITSLLKQAEDLIKQMSMEARDADDMTLKNKTKSYKRNLASIREDFEAARMKSMRDGLFEGGSGNNGEGGGLLSGKHRSQMQNTSDQLGRQNDTLSK
jgi:hypothetical protein